nr:prephenate dehydratase [uncultured Cellulosilyticum sp.]
MEEVHYAGIQKQLKISIENLYAHNERALSQIEEGLNTYFNPFPVVGYQGVPGAYGEQATINYFQGNWSKCVAHEEFQDVFDALEAGNIDYGVIPIENSSAGEVLDTYDLIKKYNLYIVGEEIVKVQHNLLGVKGAKLEDIKEVYSHKQAISQCKPFLKENKQITPIPYLNTAAACEYVAGLNDVTKAAIGSKRAGELYRLEPIRTNIHFNQNNCTRFIILARKMHIQDNCDKISICFTTEHTSGSLYNILGHFAYNGLNLLKIQSRPLLEREWEYYFFVDIEGNLQDANVLIALSRVEEQTRYLKILGNYEKFK